MTVNEKIKALRDRMSRHNIDIYIVPTCDSRVGICRRLF